MNSFWKKLQIAGYVVVAAVLLLLAATQLGQDSPKPSTTTSAPADPGYGNIK